MSSRIARRTARKDWTLQICDLYRQAKRCYRTRAAAMRAASHSANKGRQARLVPYFHEACGSWHVGHKKESLA